MGSASINFSGAVGSGSYPGNFYMQWNNVKQVVGGKGWENSNDRTVGYNVGFCRWTYKICWGLWLDAMAIDRILCL